LLIKNDLSGTSFTTRYPKFIIIIREFLWPNLKKQRLLAYKSEYTKLDNYLKLKKLASKKILAKY